MENFDFFNILSLFGGLAVLLFGMHLMSSNLKKVSGNKMENMLTRLTDKPLKGVVLGAVITAVIQSSSATTVMTVGFVNSGLMTLNQSIGIIMGANIGTTITSWILSLSGIESGNFFLRVLKPDSLAPVAALIGAVLVTFSKKDKRQSVGCILLGFSLLMFGMSMMSDSVSPLTENDEFKNIFTLFSNPLLGILCGAVVTGIIQSSAASIGILQVFAANGAITYANAIPIIMGQNIGTCATALLSCIGANKNAKRVAMVHLLFNLIGSIVLLTVFYLIHRAVDFTFLNDPVGAEHIALIHTVFNLLSTVLLLPFGKLLGRLATLVIRDKERDKPVAEIPMSPPCKKFTSGTKNIQFCYCSKPNIGV